LINKIIVVFLNLLGFFFGILGFFANRNQKQNGFFFWMALTALGVIDSAFISFFSKSLFSFSPETQAAFAIGSYRAFWVCVCLFFIFLYFFAIHFPKTGRDINAFHWIHSLIWLSWIIVAFTNFLLVGIQEVGEYTAIKLGSIQIVAFFTVAFSIFYVLYLMISKYNFLQEDDKGRAQFFFFGMAVSLILFLLLSVALPLFDSEYFVKTYLWGIYSLIFFVILTSLALFQKNALGTKSIFTQLMVVIIGLSLFIAPFFVEILWLRIIYILIFLFFMVFGSFLIRDTTKEAMQKIMLQSEVQNRIRELEDVKKRLEENKAVLEIRIQARTKALKDLANNLESQVQQRTKELEKKVQELERANQLMVDRELAMAELKKESESLKEKIKQQGNV